MFLSDFINKSEIDVCLLQETLEVQYSDNQNFCMSDHRMVVASVTAVKEKTKRKNSHWKLNENILNDEKTHKKILQACKSILFKIKHHNELWYDVFIQEIVSHFKRESRRVSFERNKKFQRAF